MTSQLRTYTINRGMMDAWVKLFTESLIPMQEKHGIKIEGTWVSDDDTRFIWIRSFASPEDVTAKEPAFYGSPEWNGAVDHARSHIARVDVQTMEPALNPQGESLRRGQGQACQLRVYTINGGMMEQWIKFHTQTAAPIQEKHGIRVEGSWVNEDQNQYIWIRSFDDAQDLEAKSATFAESPEWSGGNRDIAFSHLARLDVTEMRPV
jgi:hypothetical protein